MQHGARTPYEVYCPSCRVTFPAETRRCLHCGGAVSRAEARPHVELPPGSQDLSLEEELPKRSSAFSPFTLIWIALLLAGYLYRACSS